MISQCKIKLNKAADLKIYFMKIKIELYGASKDFSPENIIELDLKSNSHIKDLRNELIKFIDKRHNGNKNFHQIVKSSAFCSEDNNIVHDDYLISKEQKIAIIPPIAGG
jgi:molybdopterin converting factor small subunit